jgi:hypothetical protein
MAFSQDDISEYAEEDEFWEKYMLMFEHFDLPHDGWVRSEDFKTKAEVIQKVATGILNCVDVVEETEEARRGLMAWKLSDPNSECPFG